MPSESQSDLSASSNDRERAASPLQALRRVERLISSREYRDSERRFFVEGVRNFVSAVDEGLSIDTILYSETLAVSSVARILTRRMRRGGVLLVSVTPRGAPSGDRPEQGYNSRCAS